MRKIFLGLLATAALAAPIVAATAPANAAPAKPTHGQCVSSSVAAGVTGAAHIAIAQDNSLVGEYGSSTCPLVPPPGPVCTTSPLTSVTSTDGKGLSWIVNDGTVTGTVSFHADANGGTIDFHNNMGEWHNADMHGVVTPGSLQQAGPHAVVFGGTVIDDGTDNTEFSVVHTNSSWDFLHNPDSTTGYFTVKVVDGGSAACNSDLVAVLVNQATPGTWITAANFDAAVAATKDYQMAKATAGVVTTGDIVIN